MSWFRSSQGAEAAADWTNLKSGENYVGYERTENFASLGGPNVDKRHVYAAPQRLKLNQWALSGDWTMKQEATHPPPAARTDHVLLPRARPQSRHRPIRARHVRALPRIDRRTGTKQCAWKRHRCAGQRRRAEQRMYQLIRQPKPIVDRQFAIELLDAGAEAFCFTFG